MKLGKFLEEAGTSFYFMGFVQNKMLFRLFLADEGGDLDTEQHSKLLLPKTSCESKSGLYAACISPILAT